MDAKISITNVCGAQCATCPNWKEPERTMHYDDFVKVWGKLNSAPEITRILVNNVGDVNELSDSILYLSKMEQRSKPVIMTTNGNNLRFIPEIDLIIISFNGGTKATYEHTTGLNWNRVRESIREAYPVLARRHVEMHCLFWEGNKGTEKQFIEEWSDFPGHIRFGYKVENQMEDVKGIDIFNDVERIPCDYLQMLSIAPSGQILSCAHDFSETTNFGNIKTESVSDLLKNPARLEKIKEHEEGKFDGLCKKCNYNVTTEGKFTYVK